MLSLTLVLAACGSDSGSEEDRVEGAIRVVLLGDDPSKCEELMTAAFREQVAGEEGESALRKCREESKDPSAEDTEAVTVREIETGGSTATAQAALEGGSFDGQTVEIALVRDGDGWKLDQLVRFTKFNRALLVPAMEKSLEEGDEDEEEPPPHQRRCFINTLAAGSRQRIEGVLLRQNDAELVWLAQACPEHVFGGPDEERVLRTIAKLASSKNPVLCLEVATQRYLEETTRREGLAAVEKCTEGVHLRRNLTNIVRVTDIVVDGSNATGNVEVLTEGFGVEGQILVLELVKERDHWRVDRSLGFARIDRFALAKGILERLGTVGVDVTQPMTACVSAVLDRLPRPKIESLLLYPSVARSKQIFGRCVGGARERPPAL